MTAPFSINFRDLVRFVLVIVGCLMSGAASYAQLSSGSPDVIYNPSLVEIPLNPVALPSSNSYVLKIKSPNSMTFGQTATVTLTKAMTGPVPGGDAALALSYVTFSGADLTLVPGGDPTITFTARNQEKSITVTLAVPANAVPGTYGYKLKAVGWPLLVPEITDQRNQGSDINASVSAQNPTIPPPSVVITKPLDSNAGGDITVATPPTEAAPLLVDFTFTATSLTPAEITGIDAMVSGVGGTTILDLRLNGSLTLVPALIVNGVAKLRITKLGTQTVTVTATNASGTASDTTSFVVRTNILPPVVAFTPNKPQPYSADTNTYIYQYLAGQAAGAAVPIEVTATTAAGGIQQLGLSVNGTPEVSGNAGFTVENLLSPIATGTLSRAFAAGDYTLKAEATDIYGQIAAPVTTKIKVQMLEPNPTIAITVLGSSAPAPVPVFTLPAGASTMSIPFAFQTVATNGFEVDALSATLTVGTTTTTLALSATGLDVVNGTAIASGILANVPAGTHTLTVTGTSGIGTNGYPGKSVSTSLQFTVENAGVSLKPPSVAFIAPLLSPSYTRISSGAALSIPVYFRGTSNNGTATVITQLTAAIAPISPTPAGATISPVTITSAAGLNQPVVDGRATITVANAGNYRVTVTAKDIVGTVSAITTFEVKVVSGRDVYGEVFFDIDADKIEDADEFGVGGVLVRLVDASGAISLPVTTNSSGVYKFTGVAPGTYVVSAIAPTGLWITTTYHTVIVAGSDVSAPDIGLGIDFPALKTMSANGFTIGYWKNNLDKAIAGKSSGVQVSKAQMVAYTTAIGDFGLSVYDAISMKAASAIMGSSSSKASDLLSKQLVASEYNYQNGAYIGGNKTLTFMFLYWGESVLKNSSNYSSTYLTWAKDWFDGYNNSHGGLVTGPN